MGEPDAKAIAAICQKLGVLSQWLLSGEGPMREEAGRQLEQEAPRMKGKDIRRVANVDDIPHEGARNAAKSLQKALHARGQEWGQVPDWLKEEMDELYERIDAITKERDEARAAELKAKDEAINAQSMALQSLANKADNIVEGVLKAIEDKGFMYSIEELFEAMKSCSTPAEMEKLIKQGRKK